MSDLLYPHSVQQLASCRRFPSRKSSCTFLSKAAFQALFDESVCKNLQAVAFLRPRHYSKKKYKIIQLIFYGVVGIKGQLHKRKFFGGPWKGLISTCFFGAFLNKYTSSHRESYVLYHCYHITVSLFECQKQKPEISVKFIGWQILEYQALLFSQLESNAGNFRTTHIRSKFIYPPSPPPLPFTRPHKTSQESHVQTDRVRGGYNHGVWRNAVCFENSFERNKRSYIIRVRLSDCAFSTIAHFTSVYLSGTQRTIQFHAHSNSTHVSYYVSPAYVSSCPFLRSL